MAARPVVLFGYESSAFTWKARLLLKLKQVPYTFVTVPSMMPRPHLKEAFGLTYRKIPVLAIGRDVYCDSSIISDALDHFYPAKDGYGSLYPKSIGGKDYTPMMRGFAAYWVGQPFYRATCGVMPSVIWRTSFGTDRGGLIGHKINPDKLEKKIPEMMSKLDQQFSMLEPMFQQEACISGVPWVFETPTPSAGDLALWVQLWWCTEISAGRLMNNLTGGEIPDAEHPGIGAVFNAKRYPGLWSWYHRFQEYMENLPCVETNGDADWQAVLKSLKEAPELEKKSWLISTPRPVQTTVDEDAGLKMGSNIAIAPDDTGRNDATVGTLIASSPEELVILPQRLEKAPEVDVRVHFPRLGFVARPVPQSKL